MPWLEASYIKAILSVYNFKEVMCCNLRSQHHGINQSLLLPVEFYLKTIGLFFNDTPNIRPNVNYVCSKYFTNTNVYGAVM